MSPSAQQAPRDLSDYIELLRELDEQGLPYAVIGGMAVGAYARLRGQPIISADLDIVATEATLRELIDVAPEIHLEVISRPQPRAVPVAVMWWRGLEVNALTSSAGLPAAELVVRGAREFHVGEHDVVIPIADPLDLLSNKLTVRRAKDIPHIEVLRDFVEDEIVVELGGGGTTRERLALIRRYLDVLGTEALPSDLALRLIDVVEDPRCARYLAGHVDDTVVAAKLIARLEESGSASDVRRILSRRGLLDDVAPG
ncbi:MAG: hypothetical protein AB1Z98_06395 [Nannocystaceae bacterium]